MIKITNKKKLESEINKVNAIIDDLYKQREILEEVLQRAYEEQLEDSTPALVDASPNTPIRGDVGTVDTVTTMSNINIQQSLSIASLKSQQDQKFPSSTSNSLVELDLNVPSLRCEDEEENEEDNSEDSKKKLSKLFSELQTF